jgi:hypothetical protein
MSQGLLLNELVDGLYGWGWHCFIPLLNLYEIALAKGVDLAG